MKASGGILLLLGIVLIGFGGLIWGTTSNYRMAEAVVKISVLISSGGLSLIVGSILFGCGSIIEAIKLGVTEKINPEEIVTHAANVKSGTNHEKLKEILKR